MTRTEFIENIQDWWELINFCNDEGCDYCDNVYTEDAKDDYFNDDIVDMARHADDWRDLYRQLEDIPTGYDYYIDDDYDGWRGADDDDFETYKNDVLSWGDDEGIWDDDEEEEDYDEQIDEEPAPPEVAVEDEEDNGFEPEGCSIGDLFAASASCLQKIEVGEQKAKEQDDSDFEIFISGREEIKTWI